MIERLLELNDEARNILSSLGAYVELDRDEFYVFSDVHGYVNAALTAKKLVEKGSRVLMLGDYTTRPKACIKPGEDSVRALVELYDLLVRFPDRLVLLRGNHEDVTMHFSSASLLLRDIFVHLGKGEVDAKELIRIEEELVRTMREMPLVALSERGIFMHGGLPVVDLPRDFLSVLKKPEDVCKKPFYEIVRNAPSTSGETEVNGGIKFSCLGDPMVSHLFGNDVVEETLKIYGRSFVLVGHVHPPSGFRRYRKLRNVYSVCSSYASCSVKSPKIARIKGSRVEGIKLERSPLR